MTSLFRNEHAFTLVELLIVTAVLAVLSVATVLVLNPVQLLKQARDTNRFSDLASINTAVALFQVDQPSTSLGVPKTIYLSVPDSSSSCANLGLPALPSGWSYHCAATSTLTNVDGTGWIPLNFSSLSTGSPLSRLPVDPTNSTSTGNYYYTYTPGGSWELTASVEATKYKLGGASDKVSTDGGGSANLYEIGTNLSLNPVDYGDSSLVGYWPLNEGSGSLANDASGHNNGGTWYGTPSGSGGTFYSTSTTNTYVGSFNGSTDANVLNYVAFGNAQFPTGANPRTISLWFKIPAGTPTPNPFFMFSYGANSPGNRVGMYYSTANGVCSESDASSICFTWVSDGGWHHAVLVFPSNSTLTSQFLVYFDGILRAPSSVGTATTFNTTADSPVIGRLNAFGYNYYPYTYPFAGQLHDVRVYNRALSASEIQALFTSGR